MDKTILFEWFRDHWSDTLAVLAFLISGLTYLHNRRDRKHKYLLMQDFQRAEPLFNVDINHYFYKNRIKSPIFLNQLREQLQEFNLTFHNKRINILYQDLVTRLNYICEEHPSRTTKNVLVMIEDRPRMDTQYIEFNKIKSEIESWLKDWKTFIREVKVITAGKEV